MIFQIINNVALAYTDSSGTTSALVIPSGLVRLCPTTACHISINPATKVSSPIPMRISFVVAAVPVAGLILI